MEPSQGSRANRAELKATGGLVGWGVAWVATLALARFGPALWGESQHVATWVAVGVNLIAGVAWFVAFARFLRTIDDLQRKILLDALAAALGAGLILGTSYVAAESSGLLSFQLDVAALLIVMGVVYLVAFIVGKFRFR